GAIQMTATQHPDAFADQSKAEARYTSLVNRLRIDNNKGSDVVQLRVTMDDPALAADTANNIAQAYMDYNKQISAGYGGGALMDIGKSLEENKRELATITDQIKQIKTKYSISDAQASAAMTDKSLKDTEMLMAQTEAQYTGAVGELAAAQQALATTPQYIRTSSDVQPNPAKLDLDAKITQTRSDLEMLRGKFTDSHPQVVQLSAKLTDLQNELARTPATIVGHSGTSLNPNYSQFKNAVATAQAKVSSLQNSLGTMQGTLAKLKSESAIYPEAEKQLAPLLQRKLQLEQLTMQLASQEAPLKLTGAGRTAQAQIVSLAMPPGTPSFPNSRVFVLMGLAVGIIISALIVMPKAPEILYAPTVSDTLALDGSIRSSTSALPDAEPVPARPAIESGTAE
ncbi:MAG: polysaccharide biosynthesis transport protein, partial [Fimbriimonadaceae bacterium]|nr:polysaccharide biosynthesis transport protein [Fimbriimonadaceae bacterium]